MAAAAKRQLENIVEKQVVWGKEFKGAAFIADPAEIVFKDFEVGKEMVMKLKLTNVSYTFNHFKLLHIEDEFKDFFDITYTRPGRMSAGMTCVLTVRFAPKINSDIVTKVPFLAHTGPFDVPLRCLTRKCVPSLSTNDLSLGTVILGDSISQKITISNDGALDTDFEIIDIEDDENTKSGNRITFTGRKIVKGYSKVRSFCYLFTKSDPGRRTYPNYHRPALSSTSHQSLTERYPVAFGACSRHQGHHST